MAEWRDGRMAEWRNGQMAQGRNGGMVFYYIPNLSFYIYGTRQQHRQQLLNHLDVLTCSQTKDVSKKRWTLLS